MPQAAGNGNKREVPLVRIFISSPEDVAEERTLARQLINDELPKRPYFRERVMLMPIAWDDPAAQIPMIATETPQDSVNAARPRPAACDIVIVILWKRIGTPLPDSMRKPGGEPYVSGTEWEYEDARTSPSKPVILVYRRTETPTVELTDPNLAVKLEQFKKVDGFFGQFRNSDGSLKGCVNEYATPGEFKVLLSQHLEEILYRKLELAIAADEARPVSAEVPSEYLEWLGRACADVSLLGQDSQQGHAFTLNHVYMCRHLPNL